MEELYLSLTELGHIYGVTSHIMGRWLVAVGLRTRDKKPSLLAVSNGYVKERPMHRIPYRDYTVWHAGRTMQLLKDRGYKPRNVQSKHSSVASDGF